MRDKQYRPCSDDVSWCRIWVYTVCSDLSVRKVITMAQIRGVYKWHIRLLICHLKYTNKYFFRIWPNYHPYQYKHISSNFIVFKLQLLYFTYFFLKAYVVGAHYTPCILACQGVYSYHFSILPFFCVFVHVCIGMFIFSSPEPLAHW